MISASRIGLIACLAALCLLPARAGGDETAEWKYRRGIRLPAATGNQAGQAGTENYVLVELDGPIYDHARSDLGDLRIADESGAFVPYAILSDPDEPRLKRGLKQLSAGIEDLGTAKDSNTSTWILDLGYRNMPAVKLVFRPEGANFRRNVRIDGGNDREHWESLTSDEISSVRIGKVRKERLEILFHQRRARYLRVQVFNLDDRPLILNGIEVFAYPHYLLFRASAGKSYRLLYGSEKAESPLYDIRQMTGFIKLSRLPAATLDEEREPPAAPAAPAPAQSGWQRYLLWGSLIAAALVLGGLIYRLAKISGE